jgi:glutaredoxin-related protein
VVEANLRSDMVELKQALHEVTGHNTFPNIWIGGVFVGGSDTIHALDGDGELNALLRKAGVKLQTP